MFSSTEIDQRLLAALPKSKFHLSDEARHEKILSYLYNRVSQSQQVLEHFIWELDLTKTCLVSQI
jgi:hypothetical protein